MYGQRAFTCCAGVPFGKRDPSFYSVYSLVATEEEEEGGGKVSEETGVIERGHRARSGSGHQETCSVTHTV